MSREGEKWLINQLGKDIRYAMDEFDLTFIEVAGILQITLRNVSEVAVGGDSDDDSDFKIDGNVR